MTNWDQSGSSYVVVATVWRALQVCYHIDDNDRQWGVSDCQRLFFRAHSVPAPSSWRWAACPDGLCPVGQRCKPRLGHHPPLDLGTCEISNFQSSFFLEYSGALTQCWPDMTGQTHQQINNVLASLACAEPIELPLLAMIWQWSLLLAVLIWSWSGLDLSWSVSIRSIAAGGGEDMPNPRLRSLSKCPPEFKLQCGAP